MLSAYLTRFCGTSLRGANLAIVSYDEKPEYLCHAHTSCYRADPSSGGHGSIRHFHPTLRRREEDTNSRPHFRTDISAERYRAGITWRGDVLIKPLAVSSNPPPAPQ